MLPLAIFDLVREVIEHRGQLRRRRDSAFDDAFRSADRRLAVEIEFALVEIRHVSEAAAERIEADHVRIHLADAAGERIEPVLQLTTRREYLRALLLEARGPLDHLFARIAHRAAAADFHAGEQHAAENREDRGNRHRHGKRPAELYLAGSPVPLGKDDDVHEISLSPHLYNMSSQRSPHPGEANNSQRATASPSSKSLSRPALDVEPTKFVLYILATPLS